MLGGSTRRYALGFIGVAAAGGLLMLGSTFLVLEQVGGLDVAYREGFGRELAPFLKAEVTREYRRLRIPLGNPTALETWARLDRPLTRALRGFPYLTGMVVRLADGRVACRVGDPPAGPLPRIEPTAQVPLPVTELAADLLGVGFHWLSDGEGRPLESGSRVTINAFFRVPPQAGEQARVRSLVIWGSALLTAVIYVLAALTMIMTRAQGRVLNRASEQAGRLKAVGEVSGGIAHEVRNPLNAISLMLQYLERKLRKTGVPPEPSDYAKIHLELGKIRRVVDNFVKFARPRALDLGEVDLGDLAGNVIEGFEGAFEEEGVTHRLRRNGNLTCSADGTMIREVLEAVVTNSLESMREQGSGSLEVSVEGDRRTVRVSVRDSSEVTDSGEVASVFDPGFTPHESSPGLGMTVARTLVESHGGALEAAAAPEGGCLVTLTLPRRFF